MKAGMKRLVLAARMQNREDHQVRIGEQPLLGFRAGGFRRAGQFSEVLVVSQGVQMVEADAR